MRDYRYALVRYVPDLARMEPINVGVLLQGQGRVALKLSPHAAKRSDVDTAVFRRWRDFLSTEVDGEDVPLFRPGKHSSSFFHYLGQLCEGPILLSEPLVLRTAQERDFDEILQELMRDLVLPLDERADESGTRPTGRFRALQETYQFLRRGMKRYSPVPVDASHRWSAYRQVLNGHFIAVDKVEVRRELGRTADEIDKLGRVCEGLGTFLGRCIQDKPTRYVLIADSLEVPFSGQSQDDFQLMQADLQKARDQVRAFGGEVIGTPEDAATFAEDLNRRLPEPVGMAE